MRMCKKHHRDLTSLQGVCASCLRQRLFALLAAQTKAEAETEIPIPAAVYVVSDDEYVSPQRKSFEAVQVFYTPPQTETFNAASVTVELNETNSKEAAKEKKPSITSMIKGFFKFKKADDQKESRACYFDEKVCHVDRGMSPDVQNSVSESVKQTPRRVARRGHTRNVSGLTLCLSPLVRASPNVRCGGGGQAEAGFCKNRSRKLADFGRNNNY